MLDIMPKERYLREYKKLINMIDPEILQLLVELDVVVAGGTLTSLFTNREVNDIDLYFKSWDHLEVFMAYCYNYKLRHGIYDLSSDSFRKRDVGEVYKMYKQLDGEIPPVLLTCDNFTEKKVYYIH